MDPNIYKAVADQETIYLKKVQFLSSQFLEYDLSVGKQVESEKMWV